MKKKYSIGTWITIANYEYCEIILKYNFDWICIDLEHSTINLDAVKKIVSLSEKYHTKAYVRIPEINKAFINKILDAGANGLIVANVKNKDDLDKCIDYAFYNPVGNRGMGLSRAQGYGNTFESYVNKKSKEIEIIPIIESKDAINNLENILSNDLIKKSMIGPYDLSSSIGNPGNFNSEEFNLLMDQYNKICSLLGKEKGIHVVEPLVEDVSKKLKENFTFIAFSTDAIIFDRSLSKLSKGIII